MRNLITRLLAVAMVALGLAACATQQIVDEVENVEQAHFVTIAIFSEYDKLGKALYENPRTPPSIKQGILNARNLTIQAVKASSTAFGAVAQIRARIELQGESSNLATQLAAALSVLSEQVTVAREHVDAFKHVLNESAEVVKTAGDPV